jgi:hypothetical protein
MLMKIQKYMTQKKKTSIHRKTSRKLVSARSM